jgi:hypothetical protein
MKLIPEENSHQTGGPVAALHQGLDFTKFTTNNRKSKTILHHIFRRNGLAFWNCTCKCWWPCRTPGRTRDAACPEVEVVMLIIRRRKQVFSTKNPIWNSRIIQSKRTREKKVKENVNDFSKTFWSEQNSDNIAVQCSDYSLTHIFFN